MCEAKLHNLTEVWTHRKKRRHRLIQISDIEEVIYGMAKSDPTWKRFRKQTYGKESFKLFLNFRSWTKFIKISIMILDSTIKFHFLRKF